MHCAPKSWTLFSVPTAAALFSSRKRWWKIISADIYIFICCTQAATLERSIPVCGCLSTFNQWERESIVDCRAHRVCMCVTPRADKRITDTAAEVSRSFSFLKAKQPPSLPCFYGRIVDRKVVSLNKSVTERRPIRFSRKGGVHLLFAWTPSYPNQ